MRPRALVLLLILLGSTWAGCLRSPGREDLPPSEPLDVETIRDERGFLAFVIRPETQDWRVRITPWGSGTFRVEYAHDERPFDASGLDQYGYIDPPRFVGAVTTDTTRGALLTFGTLRVHVTAPGPSLFVNGHGPVTFTMTPTSHALRVPAAPDEHFFGLGQVFSKLDLRGKSLVATTRYGASDQNRLSATPFYLSTAGHGLFVETTYATTFDFASKEPAVSITNDEPAVRFFWFDGPAFTRIISSYADVTGHAPLPPKWMFGYTQSKFGYTNRAEFEDVAKRLRDGDYPADVLVLDYYWRDNRMAEWFEPAWPAHKQMLDALHAQGYRVIVHEDTEMMRFYNPPSGYAYRTERGESPNLQILDPSNPSAAKWYWDVVHRPLVKEPTTLPGTGGVDGFWLDEIDWSPETGSQPFHNGMLPAEMHNLYPNLFNKAVFEPMESDLNTRGAIITRTHWAGGQRYPYVWSGDIGVSFQSMREQVVAGQAMGLSGDPFWSNDLGGFWSQPSDAHQIRWVSQFGIFNPFFRVHGIGTAPPTSAARSREPWHFNATAQDIFRQYDKLRYELMPYVYSIARDASLTGLPMMRALVLDFQGDNQTYAADTQYMFGPAFLVAPIVESGGRVGNPPLDGEQTRLGRSVYLPKGAWIDYWTGERHDGPKTLDWSGPLARFPLFVRGGSIVPTGPVMSFVDQRPLDPLTLHVYPQASGGFVLYEDDGTSLDYRRGEHRTTQYTLRLDGPDITIRADVTHSGYDLRPRATQFLVHGITSEPNRVLHGESGQTLEHRFDEAARSVRFALPPGADEFTVTIDG